MHILLHLESINWHSWGDLHPLEILLEGQTARLLRAQEQKDNVLPPDSFRRNEQERGTAVPRSPVSHLRVTLVLYVSSGRNDAITRTSPALTKSPITTSIFL